jgi:SAM-dependent methyltransferase
MPEMTDQNRQDTDEQLFDGYYANARGGDLHTIPWAYGAPHPHVVEWLGRDQPATGRDRALVIACGLGDDAELLAARGWRVAAFDSSPTAIAWARDRFPDSPVDYRVANLFDLPAEWRQAFDLVIEVHTIQALPVTRRQETIAAIAGTVAPGGRLVVVTMTRDVNIPLRGRPWPLTDTELDSIGRHGLEREDRWVGRDPAPQALGRVRYVYTRPVEARA